MARRTFQVVTVLIVIITAAHSTAQMEIVELEKTQIATKIAGVVIDPTGSALEGVVVEERSPNWKTVLRSTTTDENGKFHLSPKRRQTVYYLQFGRSGFNWLRLKLQLDKHGRPALVVKLPIGT